MASKISKISDSIGDFAFQQFISAFFVVFTYYVYMAKTKIAINGFGRIGRIFFRQAFYDDSIDIVAINDLTSPDNLAYLLKRDSVYGVFAENVSSGENFIKINDKEIPVFQIKDPAQIPWGEHGVDIVVESTGIFESADKASAHIKAGAKRVVISAPAKDDITPTVTPGMDASLLKPSVVTSNASCTTNAITPVMAILDEAFGIRKAIMTTVHAYTATQSLVDAPGRHEDFRRGRAAAHNIVPSTTGAAIATTKVLPHLKGQFDGLAVRVPVISGSLIDITCLTKKPTSVDEINSIFKTECMKPRWSGIVECSEEQLVSSDIIANPHGSIVDLTLTKVIDGDLVKVMAWYDNEWGYCSMLLRHVKSVAQFL